jgi:hypothetical protein
MTEPTDKPLPLRLHCLGGAEAPAAIASDIRILATFPERARERFWEALGPALKEPLTRDIEAHLDGFCRAFEVSGDELGRAIRASRFLVREASFRDLPRAAFAEDVIRLAGDANEVAAILLAGFEAGKGVVRREILETTLADHGKLVESVEWRVDNLASSSRGDRLQVPIVCLTLGYREGERRDRITLQLTPEALRTLKRVCDRLVS